MPITKWLNKLWEFLRARWKFVAALGLAGGLFFVGRYTAPAVERVKIEEKIVYQDREVEKVVVVEKRVEVKGETRVVVRDRVVTPDGTVREHEEERTDTKTDTRTDTKENREIVREVRVVEERLVEKVIDRRADWRAGALVGIDLNPAWQPIPNAGPLTLGAHVEYRILGPVWVGAWGLHTGVAGASLGFEF